MHPATSAEPETARTTVVIAAKDEAAVIASVVGELVASGWKVVVVDDGSSDATGENARRAGATVLAHPVNLGQGAALQTGIDYALARGAEFVVTYDADGQHRAEDVPRLIAGLRAGADVAIGSRFAGAIEGATFRRRLFLKLSVLVSNLVSGAKLTDAHCGLRAWRAEVAPKLRITQNGMAHASELLKKMHRHGLRIVEVPVTIRYTEYSRRKGQSAFQALRILFDFYFRNG